MNKKLILALSSGLLLSSIMASPAFAAAQKPTKMTCQEFLNIDDVVKPKVVYWLEGFDKQGNKEVIFDVENTDNYYPVLVKECTASPKANLMSTARNARVKHRPS